MRKLLILIVVLGMASIANAEITLVVGQTGAQGVAPTQGDYYDPVDSELEILQSEYLWVGVYNDTDETPGNNSKLQLFLSLSAPDPATWTGTWQQYPQAEGGPLVNNCPDNVSMGVIDVGQPTLQDMWNLALESGVPTDLTLAGVLDAKELHCEEFGDVTVTLFDAQMQPIDSVVIHQIPEPITMALLGLGGLFLRRRK